MATQSDDQRRRVRWANRRVRTGRAAFGEIFYEPGGLLGPRVQPDYQLVWFHSGAGTLMLDGAERALPLGRVHLLSPGGREHFHFSKSGPTHHAWCAVHPGFMPEELRRELSAAPPSVPATPVFGHLAAAAFALPLPLGGPAEREIDFLALACFAEYLRLGRDAASPAEWNDPAHKARRCLAEHLGEEDCLKKAVKISGVSRNTLIRRFREQFNLTPSRYLWRLRTERGIAMLGETGLTVSEIAYRCGFRTPYHFSRLVSRVQGVSPLRLRQMLWGGGRR